MKVKLFLLLLLVSLVLSGCFIFKNRAPIISLTSPVSEGEEIAPKTLLTFKWVVEDFEQDALNVSFVLEKDGVEIFSETSKSEATVVIEDEGHYVAKVIADDGKNESIKEVNFKATNLKRELYNSSSGIVYIDHNDLFLETEGNIYVRFYKQYVSETDEATYERLRLNLLDEDEDGVFDAWEELPGNRSDLQNWISIPATSNYYSTDWQFYRFIYYEDKIDLVYLGVSGPYANYTLTMDFANVGFDLNVQYARYFDNDLLVAHDAAYKDFTLRERYDSDEIPLFKLETPETPVATGDTFTVVVKGENIPDFAKLYDTRYMQLTLWHGEGVTLENVEFGNFMEGYKDISGFNSNEETVALYKGFITGEDETEAVSETFATLTFRVNEDFTGESVEFALAYEGWWDGYSDYVDLPNPIFKDSENKALDGFRVDHASKLVEIGIAE